MFALNKQEIVNEMLELYRFIFDKYSSMDIILENNNSVVQFMISLIREMFNSLSCFTGDPSQEAPREQVLVV